MNKSITRIISESERLFHIEQIKDNGFSVIKSYLTDPDPVVVLLNRIWNELKSKENYSDLISPLGIQNIIKNDLIINCLSYFDDIFVRLATLGDHLQILKFFLNDPFYKLIPENDCNFILAQLNARGGKVALPFHVDTRMVTPGYQTWSMQGFMATEKISQTQGGLIVRPKSHLLTNYPDSKKNYEDAISLVLDSGDFVVFSSQLHHATNKNLMGHTPWTILFTYRCWWCKPQFQLNRLIDENRFKQLSPNQKLILGEYSQPNNDIFSSSSARHGYL